MGDLRWKLSSESVAILYRHKGMRTPEPLVFIDCTNPDHLSRLMIDAERTITPSEEPTDES